MANTARMPLSRRGEAGRAGDDVRSDLHVIIEPTGAGGVAIDLKSRVEPYYGDSIRDQVTRTLDALGVDGVRVTIDDRGALPFVIDARLEAAVRAAGGRGKADARPERLAPERPPSARDRLRRSRLYVPGNEPKFMVNAALHGPDAVILDLEDSVHADAKDAARLLVRNALRCIDFGGAERMVRINQLPLGLGDLEAVVPERPDMILIPKVDDPEQVRQVDAAIGRSRGFSLKEHPIWLMPILESAIGVEQAFAIAGSSPNVVALTIGLEDYTADMGVVKTADGAESAWARARLVNAARASGVQAIDSVYGDIGDLAGLLAWARRSKSQGYEGMGCVHPRQIPVIHEGFAPERAEIDKALRIVEAFESAQARGLAVVSLGSKMIDPPVVERARRLVDRARRMGLA